ncbi:unnamed protein product [Urochloa humidicola]
MAAAEEHHADPELPQPPSTEEDANLATFFNRTAHFAPSVPPPPSVPRFGLTFAIHAGEWDGVVRARADHAQRHGGVDGQPVTDEGVPGSASEVAMAALAATTVGEATEEEECAVCLKGYEAGDTIRTMPCAHAFHEHCIFQWLRLRRLCPFCRFALPATGRGRP